MAASIKTRKLKKKLFICGILSFAVSVLPLGLYLLFNFGYYVKSIGDGIKLTVGGAVMMILMGCAALGKLKVPGRLLGAAVFCGLCWLLNPVLEDLLVISTIYLASVALDVMIFTPLKKKYDRRLLVSETADEVNNGAKEGE